MMIAKNHYLCVVKSKYDLMLTLDQIRKPIIEELGKFDEFITKQFTADGELMAEMLSYTLSSQGKGIRPMLLLLSAKMNLSDSTVGVGQRAYLAAMLVEMTHLTSLIHDDVIDESDTRRGKPSISGRWQSKRAVILGDYILAKNLSIGMSSGQFDMVSHVCNFMTVLCEGEMLQSECAEKSRISRQSYYEIIKKKTASLIGVSTSLGAIAVKAPQHRVELMQRFGDAIGMAFQIKDDILDYTRSANTGKPSNNDLREHKITLPLLMILEKASEERREKLLKRLLLCHEDETCVDYLQYIVENEDGLHMAEEVMQEYIEKATSALSQYEPSPYRDALINLCAYIAERER